MSLPEPYWRDEKRDLTIYHGDCRDLLPCFADGEFGSVVTDPPYGLGMDYGNWVDDRDGLSALVEAVMPELRRIAQRVVLTPGVTNLWVYPEADWVMAWAFPGAGPSGTWGFRCWQPILCYGQDPYLSYGAGRRPDLHVKAYYAKPREWTHPCPKPQGFAEWLVERATALRGSVLDPFLGSGTTLAACAKLGLPGVGIELEERYCEMAAARLSEDVTYGEPNLFTLAKEPCEA